MYLNYQKLPAGHVAKSITKKEVLLLILVFMFSAELYAQKFLPGKLKDVIPGKDSKTAEKPADAQSRQERPDFPSLYPGAVAASKGSNLHRTYFTDDSYEAVRAFYLKEAGNPVEEDTSGPSEKKQAFFEYADYIVHKGGVRIEQRGVKSDAVARVFRQISYIADRGVISRSDYENIVKKYEYLHSYYYKNDSDTEIYRRYETRLTPGGAGAASEEAQRLIMSGRQQEGMALMQQISKDAQRAAQLQNSPELADEWVKCLDEISAATSDSWSVKIVIEGMD